MIRSTKCSTNQEGTPQGTCTMKDLHFNIVCTTWNPHSLLDAFEHKKVQDCIVKKISIPCNKQMSSKKREVENNDLLNREGMGVTWKYSLGD